MSYENAEIRNVDVCGQIFEIVIFDDPEQPFTTSFKVMKEGCPFPLKIPGGALWYVTFTISDEVEQDAKSEGMASPFDALYAEACRMIEVTLNNV